MEPVEFGKIMNVEDLVAVHLTEYFPKGRTILTLNSIFPEDTLRNTVHFAINHPVGNAGFYGNWDRTSYAVLAPLDKLCREDGNQVWNFNVVDTYFIGGVRLPKESTVIASSHAYEDLIENGIVDRDRLMSTFGDERHPPQPEDTLVVTKEGITYIILSWNSENLRKETRKEIARQGYKCMPHGQWNWGIGGAEQKDQERIAKEIGAKRTGKHCDDLLNDIEYFSGWLAGMRDGKGRAEIDAYLDARKRGLSESELGSDAYSGMRILSGEGEIHSNLPLLLRKIAVQKEKYPESYRHRIEKFLENNKAYIRAFIPQDVIQEFALPL